MEGKQIEAETWFTLYNNDIYNFLVYYVGHQDVEDLVQEVFMKALLSKDQFMGKATRKTWLFSIARNLAIDYLRKEKLKRWVLEPLLHFIGSGEKTVAEIVELREDVHYLYGAMNRIKTSYREVILLRGIQGFSAAETAAILNWSESKVHVTLHRGLKELRKLMVEQEKGGTILESFVK